MSSDHSPWTSSQSALWHRLWAATQPRLLQQHVSSVFSTSHIHHEWVHEIYMSETTQGSSTAIRNKHAEHQSNTVLHRGLQVKTWSVSVVLYMEYYWGSTCCLDTSSTLCSFLLCVCVCDSTFYSSCGDEGGRTNSPGTSSSGQNRDAAQRKTREEGLLPVVRLQRPSNKKVQDFTIATDPRSNRLWMKTALDVVHGI